jgi:DNA-directed RNA polymerase subunit omega
MARITTEDCKEFVTDPFELVVCAAERTKQLISGTPALVEVKNDKLTVTALREFKFLNTDELRNAVITRLRKHAKEENVALQENSEVADDILSAENIEFLHDNHDFDMSTEEEFDNNLFSDDVAEDEDKDK